MAAPHVAGRRGRLPRRQPAAKAAATAAAALPALLACGGGAAAAVAARPLWGAAWGRQLRHGRAPAAAAAVAASAARGRGPQPASGRRGRPRRGAAVALAAAVAPEGVGGDTSGLLDAALNVLSLAGLGILVSNLLGKRDLYPAEECLPGRQTAVADAPPANATHLWLQGRPLYPPFPDDTETVSFGMGCFWCSENLFMRLGSGIYSTSVGYAGGVTPNPSYEEVCAGKTNHAEVVRVVYKPAEVSFEELLHRFWEGHDPTTKNRQGNDFGTPYRSAIYYSTEEQRATAERTREQYQELLSKRGVDAPISTEILPAGEFYYAEGYHQQYDARPGNGGYCGLRPTGASFKDLEA